MQIHLFAFGQCIFYLQSASDFEKFIFRPHACQSNVPPYATYSQRQVPTLCQSSIYIEHLWCSLNVKILVYILQCAKSIVTSDEPVAATIPIVFFGVLDGSGLSLCPIVFGELKRERLCSCQSKIQSVKFYCASCYFKELDVCAQVQALREAVKNEPQVMQIHLF